MAGAWGVAVGARGLAAERSADATAGGFVGDDGDEFVSGGGWEVWWGVGCGGGGGVDCALAGDEGGE